MDDELTEMKKQLEELKVKYAEALKVDEEFKQKIATNPDIIRLRAQERELDGQHLDVMEKRQDIIKNIYLLFTTDGRYPTFQHKTPKYSQYTNIKREVLDIIVQDVGKLYMLRNDDIIHIVDNMVHIETEKHPELVTLEREMNKIEQQRRNVGTEEDALLKKLRQGWENTSYDLQSAIRQLEKNIADYSKDESRAKRDEKIEQVRNKAREFATAEAINKKLRGEN